MAYRLDRLSRSLSDFMKLIDRFKAAGVAFVQRHRELQHRQRGRAADDGAAGDVRGIRAGDDFAEDG